MIPENRLVVLLDEVKNNQIADCPYHNTIISPSLLKDHKCNREQFPTKTSLELSDHTDEVWFVSFSHDGRWLASSSKDKSIILYNTQSFEVKHRLLGHSDGVGHVAWSPDDKLLLSSSQDHKAKLWDVEVCQINICDDAVLMITDWRMHPDNRPSY
jgi:WD repeat-containing protein 26